MKLPLTLALVLPALTGFSQNITSEGGSQLTVENGALLYVGGTIQLATGATLTNAGTIQLTGDLTNAGTLTSPGKLLFSGSTNQTLTPGTATVGTLVQSNSGATGQNTLALPADLTISKDLILTSGLVRTAPAATLTLPDGAALTGEASGSYVQGNLKIIRNAGSGVLDFGHGATLDRTGLGTVAITRTAGLLTDNLSRGTNFGGTTATGIDRIWTVESEAAPAAPVPVTLAWLPDDDNGITSFSQAQAWRAPVGSSAWVALGTAQAATNRSFSFATAALGRLTVASSNTPLPVELTRFVAEAQGADALLQWATASEQANDHFDVEASPDGKTFTRIGQVAGHGTTTQPQQYKLVDPAIAHYAADPVYYRLRQVDKGGTGSYSPVRTVRVNGLVGFTAQVYPNPSHNPDAPTLLIRTAEAGPVTWQLTDALGRTLQSQTVELPLGTSTLSLSAANLSSGVYLVQVQQGKHHQAIKLVRE